MHQTDAMPLGFRDGLLRFRSQLLTESQLISYTALIYMLKFRAFAGGVQRERKFSTSGLLGLGWAPLEAK